MLQNTVTHPLMSHDYSDDVIISFLDQDSPAEGQKALGLHLK